MSSRLFCYKAILGAAALVFCWAPLAAAQAPAAGAPTDGALQASGGRGGRGNSAAAAAAAAALAAAAAKPTPRTANGHPDLSGSWDPPAVNSRGPDKDPDGSARLLLGFGTRTEAEESRPQPPDRNPPPYKPELLAKVKALADDSVDLDPGFLCKPLGVPRIGAPKQIIESGELIVFLYQVDSGDGDAPGNAVRLIHTDGRPHRTDLDPSYFGDSIAHWESDTLVVDVTGFTDETWLGARGYFHSEALHVVERLTRKGDTLQYQATAEDPKVLTGTWKVTLNPEMLLHGNDDVIEAPPCVEMDQPHLTVKHH